MSIETPSTAAAAPGAPGESAAYRRYVFLVLYLIAIMNSMDKTIVPAMAQPLMTEFSLSDSQFGFLSGLAFAIAFTAFGIPVGLLIDRVNRAKLLACLATIWGAMTMVLGMAPNFMVLILGRMGVAGAESGGTPTSVSLVSDYYPPHRRSTAIGILYSTQGVAAFLSFAVAGWIGAQFGWRAAFFCAGAPAILFGLLAFFTLREPRRGAFDPPPTEIENAEPRPGVVQILKTMIANRSLRYLASASITSVFGVAGTSAFMAVFYYRVHDLSLAQAGLVTGIVMGGAYAVGSFAGGFLSDLSSKRSAGGGCYFVAGATLLAAPIGIAGFLAPSLVVSMAFMFVFKVLVGTFFGATFSGISKAAPLRSRGAVTAYMSLVMNLVGYGVGPQVAGVLSDAYGAAGYADPLKWSLVSVSTIFVLSAGLYVLAGRSLQADALARAG